MDVNDPACSRLKLLADVAAMELEGNIDWDNFDLIITQQESKKKKDEVITQHESKKKDEVHDLVVAAADDHAPVCSTSIGLKIKFKMGPRPGGVDSGDDVAGSSSSHWENKKKRSREGNADEIPPKVSSRVFRSKKIIPVHPVRAPAPLPAVHPVGAPAPLPAVHQVGAPAPLPAVHPVGAPAPLAAVHPVGPPVPFPAVHPVGAPALLPAVHPVGAPAPLPEAVRNHIIGSGGRPESVALIIQKNLTKSDVKKGLNRLSMPHGAAKEKFEELLSEAEVRGLKEGGLSVTLVEPGLEECEIGFRDWEVNRQFVLVKPWNDVVDRHGLRENMNVQVWLFRRRSSICFALILTP